MMGAWLKRLSVVALCGFPLAVILFRLGLVPFSESAVLLQVTLLLALGVFFTATVVSFTQKSKNPQSAQQARLASYLVLLPIVGLGWQILTATSLPMIHNISTDTQNPPQFQHVQGLRKPDENSLDYSTEIASLQRSAYPQVKTLYVDQTPDQALIRALELMQQLDWALVNADIDLRQIEATDTTFLWGFKDDVVIRITPTPSGGSAVDLRSVSRIGRSDLGVNAKRIERFLSMFIQ